MPTSTKINQDRVSRNVQPLLDIDWTKIEGTTPFMTRRWQPPQSNSPGKWNYFYSVAVDTGVSSYPDLNDNVRTVALETGVRNILKFHNKAPLTNPENFWQVHGSIVGHFEDGRGIKIAAPPDPYQEASGTYVPIRPEANIVVLVEIPEEFGLNTVYVQNEPGSYSLFRNLPEAPKAIEIAYDEIELNTFRLKEDAGKVAELLRKYHQQATSFEGMVYNINFEQQADKVEQFVSVLKNLVQSNGVVYSNNESDLIILNVSGSGPRSNEYRAFSADFFRRSEVPITPDPSIYGQGPNIETVSDIVALPAGFTTFRDSPSTNSNTTFIFKHLSEILKITDQKPTIDENGRPAAAVGWEKFLHDYIHFPPAIIEYSTERPESPPKPPEIWREISKQDTKANMTAEELAEQSKYYNSTKFRDAIHKTQKDLKQFVGDDVLKNIDKTINKINSVEDLYEKYLNKMGLKSIVDAAVKCLEIDLPIEEAKAFLMAASQLARQTLPMLKVPVLWLDDLLPTMDMMGDIAKQVGMAILEALLRTLLALVKQIVMMYLEACGDPCKLNFDSFSIEAMVTKGASAVVGGVSSTLSGQGGGTPLLDTMTGQSSVGMEQGSRKFLKNLNASLTPDQMNTLTSATQALGSAAGASSPLSTLFDSLSSTLTCGEVGKMMNGKTPPEAVKIIQQTACGLAQGPIADANEGFAILCDLFGDQEKVDDFFLNVGKVADLGPITQQIEAMEEMIPSITSGLCDADDSFLRCQLLQGKGITNDETCLAQINASRVRARNRISQISDLLNKQNPLDGIIPPVYCKAEIDPVTKELKIIEGLIPRDHPTFLYMFDKTLDTTFFGAYRAFIQDATNIANAMTLEHVTGQRAIPRVLRASGRQPGTWVDGRKYRINPEFTMALQQGALLKDNFYWPFLQFDATSYGDGHPNGGSGEQAQIDTILWNKDAPEASASATAWKIWYDCAPLSPGAVLAGGCGSEPDHYWGTKDDPFYGSSGRDEATDKYGPVFQDIKEMIFCPGMSGPDGVYNNFQTSLVGADVPPLAIRKTLDQNHRAREQLNVTRQTLQFTVKNPIRSDFEKFEEGETGKTLLELFKENVPRDLLEAGFNVGEAFGVERYALFYASFSDVANGKDKFVIQMKADSTELWTQMFELEIPQAWREGVMQPRGLEPAATAPPLPDTGPGEHTMPEKRFVSFLKSIWADGENIYVNGTLLPTSEREIQSPYIGGITVDSTQPQDALVKALLKNQGENAQESPEAHTRTLYEELLRDLQAKCVSEVGKSKLLGKDIFQLIDFAPIPKGGCADTSLLALPALKQEIKDIYKRLQCIQNKPRNRDGLSSDWDQPLEQATLYGIVKAIVRVYVYETLIKCLVTFSQLNIQDVNEVFVGFVRKRIKDELAAFGYLQHFMIQCLESYKAHAGGYYGESDPNKALNYIIRQEFRFCLMMLLQAADSDDPKRRIENLLFMIDPAAPDQLAPAHWIPQFDVSMKTWEPNVPESALPGGARHPHLQRLGEGYRLSNYGITAEDTGEGRSGGLQELVGLKDWRNGNIYLEKYIRAEYKEPGEDSLFPPPNLNAIQNTDQIHRDYRNVVNKYGFGAWFREKFADIQGAASSTIVTTPPPIVVSPDDCGPGGSEFQPPDVTEVVPSALNPQEIGSYFKTLRYGLRLVCQVVNDDTQNSQGIKHQPITELDTHFGDIDRRSEANKAYKYVERNTWKHSEDRFLDDDEWALEGRGSSHQVTAYTFPIVCVEHEITPNTLISNIINDGDFFINGYDQVYENLVESLKETPEYGFIFDYCFPMDRLVSLSALYNLLYVLPYPALNDVFTSTKAQLKIAFKAIRNSGLYNYEDPDHTLESQANSSANNQELPGFDWAAMAKRFLFAAFRGAAETFDPNIAVGIKIHDAAELAGQKLKQAVNKAVELAGRAAGQSEAAIRDNQIGGNPCDQPSWLDNIDIPMAAITAGLMPTFFGSLWNPYGWGPPLTLSLGMPYLIWFGFPPFKRGGLDGSLSTAEEKSKMRCKAIGQGIDLTGPAQCREGVPFQYEPPEVPQIQTNVNPGLESGGE